MRTDVPVIGGIIVCEPLKKKRRKIIIESEDKIPKEIIMSNFFLFDDIKSAIEFYQKYSKYGAEPYTLRNDNEELYDKWLRYRHKHDWTNGSNRVYETYYYMKWLFNYCFQDVIQFEK